MVVWPEPAAVVWIDKSRRSGEYLATSNCRCYQSRLGLEIYTARVSYLYAFPTFLAPGTADM